MEVLNDDKLMRKWHISFTQIRIAVDWISDPPLKNEASRLDSDW